MFFEIFHCAPKYHPSRFVILSVKSFTHTHRGREREREEERDMEGGRDNGGFQVVIVHMVIKKYW